MDLFRVAILFKFKKYLSRISVILCLILITPLLFIPAGCRNSEEGGNPVQGGTLVYAITEDPNELNPYAANPNKSVLASNISQLFYEGLIKIDEKMTPVPVLATEIPTLENKGISTDGLTITYHLRHGVKWSDGKAFTSRDVKATWEMIINPKIRILSREGYNKIKSVETPNDSTVVFHLKEAYAPFTTILFPAILPANVLKQASDVNNDSTLNDARIATGPFELKEREKSQSLVAVANKNYWGKKPYLERIEFRIIPDKKEIIRLINKGEIDWADDMDYLIIEQAKKAKGARVLSVNSNLFEIYGLNHNNPILADLRVRQALAYGCDREAIVKKLYPDSILAPSDQHPLNWAYNKDLKPWPYDPWKAKSLLEEAGWVDTDGDGIKDKEGKPLTLNLAITDKEDRIEKAEILKEQWKKIGVEIKINRYSYKDFFGTLEGGGILSKGNFDIAIFALASGVDPDDSSMWCIDQIPTEKNPLGGNQLFYRNLEVDNLCKQGLKELDRNKRLDIYLRIQKLLQEDVATVFERFWLSNSLVKNRVHGVKLNPTPQGNLWNAQDIWVEASK